MEMGKKLRMLREKRNMTIYRLTQITGISGHHIKGIEEGTRQPTIETLQKLLTALGTTLVEFFNNNEQCTYLSENERKLIDNFRSLSESKAQVLLIISSALND